MTFKILFQYLKFGAMTDSGWTFLSTFGVLTEKNVDFYLRQLRALQDNGHPPLYDILKSIYDNIGRLSKGDAEAGEKVR
jgi:hypothetical protein